MAQNSHFISKLLLSDWGSHFAYRIWGNIGLGIPVVSMGTGNCFNANLIKDALDRGVKLLATHEHFVKTGILRKWSRKYLKPCHGILSCIS
jgi:hypothetical protein